MNNEDLLTIVILTYNEEVNIKECIISCRNIASRIVVLDNNSNDNTRNIASLLGAEVINSDLMARDRIAMALSDGFIKTKWVLFFDADERMTEESSREFAELCDRYQDNENIKGIVVRYRQNFMGKDLFHGGYSPLRKLRAFKPGAAYYEIADVDEHYVLKSGKYVYMKNDFLHLDYKGIKNWVDKHTIYAQRAAVDYIKKMKQNEEITYSGLEHGAKIKRFLKYTVYYKLPIKTRAWMFYFYCYYLRLGFLDGKEGQIYAFLHAYWYRFMVDTFIIANELVDQQGQVFVYKKEGRER